MGRASLHQRFTVGLIWLGIGAHVAKFLIEFGVADCQIRIRANIAAKRLTFNIGVRVFATRMNSNAREARVLVI